MDKNIINEDYSFTTLDDNGNEVLCDTLALIKSEDNPIIIYTDYTIDNENRFKLYISQIIPSKDGFILEEINNYDDIPEIRATLERLWEENKIEL